MGWIHKFRLRIRIPRPIISGNLPALKENEMFLSLETSEILRVATNSAFPEEVSTTAFHSDLQKYTDQHGSSEGKTMENHLILLSMGPSDFLKHIYQIIHLPDIN